jgi:ankyrin repeat protein
MVALGGDSAAVTYFVAAAEEGNEERITLLSNYGVDVNAADAGGRTALFVAAAKGNLPIVRKLLAAHADVNLANAEGRTPLMAAAAAGATPVIAELLGHASARDVVNATDAAGYSAIHYAIGARSLEAIRLLLARGANCTRPASDGNNAIALAFDTGDREIAKTVLTAQPPTLGWDKTTREVLFGAIHSRDQEMTRLLLAKHPKPPTLEDARQPLLAYMVAWNDLDDIKFMLDCGANPNATLATPAEKPFLQFFKGEMIPHYLTTEPGMTPLMLAAAMGNTEMVQTLLAHGAKKGALTEKYKIDAVIFAAWADSAPTLLVLHGKSPRIEDQQTRVEISLGNQRANFFKDGQLALSTPVSTGKPGYRTPTGQFVVTDKHPTHKSTIYKVDMPFFMRLNCREFGMHAGVVPNYPASHGCIRMPGEKVRELFKQVEVGTLVTIVN